MNLLSFRQCSYYCIYHVASSKQYFCAFDQGEEDPETKQIIDRALHLAKVTTDAALAERRNSDSFSPWRRPASARGTQITVTE